MKIGRWLAVFALIGAAAIVAWYMLGTSASAETYVTTPVRRGPIAAVVAATGTVNPVITVQVGSQVSGQVASLDADFNSVVHKGQVIATLDPSNLQAQVARDRANVASASAALEKARVEADNAARGFARAENLKAQALIPESDYDSAQAAAAGAAASVKTAQASVAEAQASLRISEVNLDHATILSPVDGIVISRTVDVGQTVAASLQAPTLFTIAQDLRKMEVHMNVAESDIGRLQVAQPATFTVDAYPSDRFRGTISEIRNAPTTIQNVVTYEAVIDVNNDDLRLKPGMTANVSVVVAERADALLVPNAALRFKPPESAMKVGDDEGSGKSKASSQGSGAYASTGAGNRGSGGGRGSEGSARGGASGGRNGAARGGDGGDRRAGVGANGADSNAGGTVEGGSPRGTAPSNSDGASGSGAAPSRSAQPGSRSRPGPSIWILDGETPRKVSVKTGITDGAWSEIVSGEVQEGDPAITELSATAAAAQARPAQRGIGRMF